MTSKIFEELPARKFAPAAPAASKDKKNAKGKTEQSSEERISQAASDIKYRARRENIDLKQAYAQYMQNSSMSPAEKVAVKSKIFGKSVSEDYLNDADNWAVDSVAQALYTVFVEGIEKEQSIECSYIKELADSPERKYKVRVTDKKTGKSYVRYATRDKITQLRLNPNIQSVEMTEYGEPYEGEKRRGESTAKAKSGKGLDPVGKEDADVDNDGKKNDSNDRYIMKRRKAIGSAIAMRKEEFLADGTESTEGQNLQKITGKGVDNSSLIKVFPTDASDPQRTKTVIQAGTELEGEMIAEKAMSKAQQRFMGMVYAAKKGEKAASPEVAKAAAGMSKKEAKKFATTKHKGLPEKVKEEACGPDNKENERDARGDYAKTNLIKNKLRSTGLKMSYEPEGEQVNETMMSANRARQLSQQGGSNTSSSTLPRPSASGSSGSGPLGSLNQLGRSVAGTIGGEIGAQQGRQKYGNVLGIPERIGRNRGTQQGQQTYDNTVGRVTGAIGNVLKQSYEPEGEQLDEFLGTALKVAAPFIGLYAAGKGMEALKPSVNAKIKKARETTKIGGDARVPQTNSYELDGEVLDERRAEDRGKPRPKRDRALEIVRSMPNAREGLMTRSGKTVAQHESERGVSEKDRPKKSEETTADRLARKKQREAAARAAAERGREEEDRRRRLS